MIMFGAMILVIIKGTINVGGFETVWERNWDSGRIEAPSFDPNPFSRHTFFTLVVGGSIHLLQNSTINQNMIQRYLSLQNLKKVNRSLWIFVIGIFVIIVLCSYIGMLIYATFYRCDPLTTKLAREKDQLLPLLIMEVLSDYPGLPGLFIAGIFSASLSSLSTGLNAMAAVVLEDFYKSFFKKELSEKGTYILMKSTVIILGSICVGLVFVVEKLGTILQLTSTIMSISDGPCLSLFTMGLLLPWIHANAALIGGITGLVVMSWICLGAQLAIVSGDLIFPEKPVSIDDCHYNFTPKLSLNLHVNLSYTDSIQHNDEVFMLYRLSYLWYTATGCVVSIVVALVVSLFTKPNDPRDLDQELLAPCVRRFFHRNQSEIESIVYTFERHIIVKTLT